MKIRALVDPRQKLVGCVILQALYGGDRLVVSQFNDWLTAPSPTMGMVELTTEEWSTLADEWNNRRK